MMPFHPPARDHHRSVSTAALRPATTKTLPRMQAGRKWAGGALVLALCGLWSPLPAGAEGTWMPLQQLAPAGIGTMLLLSDGTVMAQGGANQQTKTWYRLTPGSTGGYTNGTWTTRASMNYSRLFYSSAVLRDGRVFVAGAEYGTGTTNAEVYNPFYGPNPDSWMEIPVPAGLIRTDNTNYANGQNSAGFSDSGCVVLADGDVLITPVNPAYYGGTVLFDAASNTSSLGPTINSGGFLDEATMVKLPDDSILVVDSFTNTSERYIPSLSQWIADANVPVNLYDSYGGEMGAGFMLPNGKAFFLGSTPVTALYTPSGDTSAGTWTAGPNIPGNLGAPDAPAAMMANGKILCALAQTPYKLGGTNYTFTPPTYFYEYDYSAGANGAFTQVHAPNGSFTDSDGPSGGNPFSSRMLDLPDGTVLFSDGNTNGQLYVYIPDASPLAAGKPAVQSLSWNADGSLHLSGTRFNGISAGAGYGDDAQMDSNYPLIRFTDGIGNVLYGITYNWSSTGVMTSNKVVTTEATAPSAIFNSSAHYALQVVANGIASDPIAFNPLNVTFNPLTNTETVFDFSQLGGMVNESATLKFRIEQYDASGNNDLYWNGSSWIANGNDPSVYLAATITGGIWSRAGGVTLPTRGQTRYGPYFLRVVASDVAGNATTNEILVTRSATDTTPPVVTLDTIHNNDVITNQSLPGLSGSALDYESGIASVNVYLNWFTNSQIYYWTGSAWSTTPATLAASYDAPTVAWQVTDPLPSGANLPNGSYQVQVSAQNNESPAGTTLLSVNFSVDYHPVYVFNYGSQFTMTPNMKWDSPDNWDVGRVPTADAIVVITNFSPDNTSLGSVPIYGLDMSGGTLATSGMLIQKINFSGGTINGGTINVNTNGAFNWFGGAFAGTCSILTGGVMNVSNAATKTLADYATIINGGTINWQGGGLIIGNGYSASSFITNLPGASFQAAADGPIFSHYNSNPIFFVNAGGLFAKVAGTGTNSVDSCHFINTGTVRCDSGLLAFNAQLDLNPGGIFTGSATNRVAGGALNVTGLTVVSNGVLDLADGQFTGAGDGSGAFGTTGSGKLVWSGGVLNGTLNLAANASAEIAGPATKTFSDSAVLNNHGQLAWLNGTIMANAYSAPSYLNNYTGATFTIAATNGASRLNGNSSQFENQPGATLVVNIPGESLWNGWQLDNDGTLTGVTGRLNLALGGASSGTFANGAGSEVAFTAGTFLLHAGTHFTGAGTARIAGATLTADGPAVSDGSSFQLDSGVLNGVGFVSSGQFYWNGGTIGGTCSNAVGGVFTMTGSNDMVLADGAVFNNNGTARLLNRRLLANGYSAGAAWNNLAGALFDVSSDGGVFGQINGNDLVFNNFAGARFAKISGTNSVLDAEVLNNLGELGCDTGTLTYATTINLNPGGTFTGAGQHLINGGSVTWAGTNTVQNSSLNFSNGVITGISNATVLAADGSSVFDWSGGTLAGIMTLPAGSTLLLSSAANKILADNASFTNAGTARFTGAGQLLANGYSAGATWNNLAGSHFNFASDGSGLGHINSNPLVFNNLAGARLAKITGTNSIIDSTVINNSGELGCDSGTFTYNTTLNLNPGGVFTGAGQHLINGGTVTWTGTNSIQNSSLNFSNGLINGASDATAVATGTSQFAWSGGTLAGFMTLPAGSALLLSGAADKILADNTVFTNAGTVLLTGAGRLVANGYSAGATWNNLAGSHFNLASDGSSLGHINGNPIFFNNFLGARLAKITGTNSIIDSTVINNSGELGCDSGTFTYNTTLNLNPGGVFTGVGEHLINGGTVTWTGTNSIQNSSLNFSNGVITGISNATVVAADGSSLFDWSGGTLAGFMTLPAGSALQLSGAADKILADNTAFTNAGTVLLTGAGRLMANGYNAGATWNNLAGSHFNLASDGSSLGHINGNPIFFNNFLGARLAKIAGTNSTVDSTVINNSGELGCDSGTFTYNTTLNLNPGGVFTGAGQHLINGGTVTWTGTNSIQNSSLNFSNGLINGISNATVVAATGSGLFAWTGGTLAGALATSAGSTIQLSGGGNKVMADGALLNNAGAMIFTGSGPLLANAYIAGAVITNLPGGVIQVFTNATLGRINGAGCLLVNDGSLCISNAPSLFQTDWNYVQTPSGTMNLVIAGPNPGASYSQFAAGSVTLDGSMAIALGNGYVPQTTNAFDVLTYSGHSGQFASTQLPPLPAGFQWQLAYNANALALQAVPTTAFQSIVMTNGNFQFILVGQAGSSCLIEASTNLFDWTPILTNTPFTGSLDFADPQTAQFPKRFYRATIFP